MNFAEIAGGVPVREHRAVGRVGPDGDQQTRGLQAKVGQAAYAKAREARGAH